MLYEVITMKLNDAGVIEEVSFEGNQRNAFSIIKQVVLWFKPDRQINILNSFIVITSYSIHYTKLYE